MARATSRRTRPSRSNAGVAQTLQFKVLGTINLILIVSLSVFMIYKYMTDLDRRLEDRRQSLQNDASMLSPILLRLHHQPRQRRARTALDDVPGAQTPAAAGLDPTIQRVLDVTCMRMQEQTRGYMVVASVGDRTYEAQTAQGAPSDAYRMMVFAQQSPQGIMEVGKRLMLVGSATSGDVTVYVAENVADVMRQARGSLYANLIAMGCFGLAVTAALNLIMIRLVIQPLHQLTSGVRRIGLGRLGTRVRAGETHEFRVLSEEINAMAGKLAESERHRQLELEKANQIQKNIAPDMDDAMFLGITIRHQPATEVTGDYYDIKPVGPDKTLLCVADVTGHGVPAALEASMLKTLFDIAQINTSDPGAIVELINKPFSRVSLDEDFASMFVLELDRAAKQIRYASAGHEPAYLLRPNGELHMLPSTGPLLGIIASATWTTKTLPAERGDRVIIVTDGLAETMDAKGKLLGRATIEHALVEMAEVPSENLTNQLINIATQHRGAPNPKDDITLLVTTV